MQQKIERTKIRQFKSLDVTFDDSFEVIFDPLRRHLTNQQGIEGIAQSDDSNVGSVAFVAGTRVRQFCKLYFHVAAFSDVENFDARLNLALGNQGRPVRDNLFDFWSAARETGHGGRAG